MRNTHKDMFVQCYYYSYQGDLKVPWKFLLKQSKNKMSRAERKCVVMTQDLCDVKVLKLFSSVAA